MRLLALALPIAMASILAPPALAQAAPPAVAALPDSLKDPKAQEGYIVGFQIGAQMRTNGVAVDPEAVGKGVRDGLANAKPQLSEDQMRAAMAGFQAEIKTKRQDMAAKDAQAGVANRAAGAAFLKANGAKPGVVTLPSGLQYLVVKAGPGAKPKAGDTVTCSYRGTLIDGTEFDSSASHGGPISFPVTGVIPGWTEALQLMPVGSKWRLFVPADLAYGDKGAGPKIGPGVTLVFEVELVSIKAGQ
ncbi:MAG: FKBP-type peptidyl-prolyl cis-trans isomerase [Caulobacteraceae bacterium]